MSLWWLALPVLLLPIFWHRQKRETSNAAALATARFLPRADPRQVRVWAWRDRALLLLRCLLLACLIARLADLVVPWRGDSVLVVPGTDPVWSDAQVRAAGLAGASRIELPSRDALGWFAAHEREWRAGARVLAVGDVAMSATAPQLRHQLMLKTAPAAQRRIAHHVAVMGARRDRWQGFFAAASLGPDAYVIDSAPRADTELIVWDSAAPPPAAMHAPLWWVTDPAAFPELNQAHTLAGAQLRYADSAHGRVWLSADMPPADADSARRLLETWQRLHYHAPAYTAPPQTLAPAPAARAAADSGALRAFLDLLLIVMFAAERMLAHARRNS